MMSSEEETECFGLYGEKLLKKAKRTRQRVDAGEPRNSYSSIPNFSSRPSFLSGGLYGAIFSQSHQHFGLFGPGFTPAKMLNELLGRQGKVSEDAMGGVNHMDMSGGSDKLNGGVNFDCMNATSVIRRGLDSPPLDNAHMLRDILQGRKKELLALEQELRESNRDFAGSPNNNNNNEVKNSVGGGATVGGSSGVGDGSGGANGGGGTNAGSGQGGKPTMNGGDVPTQNGPTSVGRGENPEAGSAEDDALEGLSDGGKQLDMDDGLNGPASDTEPSSSPVSESLAHKDDAKDSQKELELKRARVENIVSSMRSSPSLPTQVNGCKKRKLYHPQQHESVRYAASLGLLDEDEPQLKQKRVEKDALKSQLRTMQEQLAEMQQKYVQLCNRMEMESDCQDDTSDMNLELSQTVEQESAASVASMGLPPVVQESKPSHPTTPVKDGPPPATAPVMPKIPSAKLHPNPNPHPPIPPPTVNGGGPMVHEHPEHPHHPHHGAANNPAAMYLGHKLFMEQEARLAKEAAVAAAVAAEPKHSSEFSERFTFFRNAPLSGADLEGLAEVLKTEITASLAILIDTIVGRFVQQRRFLGKHSEAAAEQLNKDLLMASQLLDRKSPRTKVIDRGGRMNGNAYNPMGMSNSMHNPENNLNSMNLPHIRPPVSVASMFQPPKPPGGGGGGAGGGGQSASGGGGGGSTSMYSMSSLGSHNSHSMNPYCMSEGREGMPEQNEALSLVVTPKKKRHKVTDTRITPRTVSRILSQDGDPTKYPNLVPSTSATTGSTESPSPRPYHPPPPPILPVSLPTSVAIPNPSLHESQVFSPYSPFYGQHHSSSPPDRRDSESPIPHPPTLLHPAILAAHSSPDYVHLRGDSVDRGSDCNSGDGPYDGMQPTISFPSNMTDHHNSLTLTHSSTLTPMHLRKAKLMFFWVRYPSSAVLKMYFPDIKFNKNNTAQLVKWFSNFREFYYIQMEKYARQSISEGVKSADDLHVTADSEIYRVLNLHYNRNNHIEGKSVDGYIFQVPSNFRFVVEQTLREFFKAIQGGKDTEQSWKKSIYKIISRMDDPVPEYFKSPNFLEQLE